MRRRDEAEADAGEIAAQCDCRGEEWSRAGKDGERGADGTDGAIVVPKVKQRSYKWSVCWDEGKSILDELNEN